MFLIAVSIIRQ